MPSASVSVRLRPVANVYAPPVLGVAIFPAVTVLANSPVAAPIITGFTLVPGVTLTTSTSAITVSVTTLAFGVDQTVARAFGSVTVALGDKVAIVTRLSDPSNTAATVAKTAGTATIGAATTVQTTTGSGSLDTVTVSTFSVIGAGTMTITVTSNGIFNGDGWDADMIVATGSSGIGTSVKNIAAQSASLTASANSYVFANYADWSGGAVASTWVPSGATVYDVATDGVTLNRGLAYWPTVAGGTATYGVGTPAISSPNVIVWEFLR